MNWTKMAALFVLALFVISVVPIVAAEEGSDSGSGDTTVEAMAETSAETGADTEDAAFHRSREALKTQAETKRAELRAKREGAREAFKTDIKALKVRQEELERELRSNRERMKQIREEYKSKRGELKDQREAARISLGEARAELRDCAGKDTEGCKQARANAKVHASAFLNRAAEHIISVLEQARERVEASDMTDAQKAEVMAEIEEALVEIAAAKENIASLGEDATKEDLKDAAQIIREAWHKAKKGIKHGVGQVASHRIGGVIVKMEHLEDKFDRVITRLEKAGKDTSAAEAKRAEFEAKLDAAEKLHAEAKALFESGDHSAAAEKIRAAHAELKAAHEILKGLVQEIRGIGGGKALEEESEEAEEESDEADEDEAEEDESEEDESDEEESDEDEAEEDESEEAPAEAGTEANTDVGATV